MQTAAMHTLTSPLTLLSWNVHKELGQKAFNDTFTALLQQYGPQLVLLQEAVLDRRTQHYFDGYTIATAANIDLRRKQYGVLTASAAAIDGSLHLKTHHRELHFATKKSLLIATHTLGDGRTLTTVNLHAINFVSANIFIEEINRLVETLRSRSGPMIVTGDFNTWNTKRMEYVDGFAMTINLTPAKIDNYQHIKRRFTKPLDHLYYRELTLKRAEAVDTQRVSDHNPIIAVFDY